MDSASRKVPERTFLRLEDGSTWSYGTFRTEVERLASHLYHQHGVAEGDRIAVHLGNTLAFCLAVFAVLRLGGSVVPLNIKLRTGELEVILEDVRPRLVLSGGQHVDELQQREHGIGVLDVDQWVEADHDPWSVLPAVADGVLPGSTAFIMYTSGTTGSPKGVVITHGNVLQACRTYKDGFGLTSNDVTVIAVPIYHGTGLFGQLFPMVYVAGEVVLQEFYDTAGLLSLIESNSATHFIGVPTMFIYLLKEPNARAGLESLQKAGSGGAPLPVAFAESLANSLPWVKLFNTYGMTETTSPATMLTARHFLRKLGSVGIATPGMRARVRDISGGLCAPGAVGELELIGPLVSPGYWNNLGATRSAFSSGWLQTGDLATMDEEGYIFLRGRLKDMISRGGEKIYPAEVEEVLMRHDAVAEVNVFGVANELYGEVVKAQVVAAGDTVLDTTEIAGWCRQHLAKYKVPSEIELVDYIEKNASGKPLKPRIVLNG